MSMILAPSLLSANLAHTGKVVADLEKADISWLHLDVMDGSFVPNITFGMPLISALRPLTNLFFDVHLMIENPERHIDEFAKSGADLLVFHIEACHHPQRALAQIHHLGLKAGIALNPDTDFNCLRWLLADLDLIMLMSVNPGFSGQKFIPQVMDKLKLCRKFLIDNGYEFLPIEIDGGISQNNCASLLDAGANVLVSGSSFFSSGNFSASRESFERIASQVSNRDSQAQDIVNSWKHIQKGQSHA